MRVATPATRLALRLGLDQTLSWGSSFYLPAVLGAAMAGELGLAPPVLFALFSGALVVSAAVGPLAGRWVDRHGGRPVLLGSHAVFVAGLLALSQASGLASLAAAWALLGLAMGAGLYETAFASVVRLQGTAARATITGITLIAGFASTVGWPLSSLMAELWGWRGACLGWAALHLVVGLPLAAGLPRLPVAGEAPAPSHDAVPAAAPALRHPALVTGLLAFVFAVAAFNGTAMATHLPGLLQGAGASLAAAVAAGALIGPAQVGARLAEFTLLRRWHPLWTARLAVLTHPLGAALLLAGGAALAAPFALLHGAGNGVLTIVKGTLPLQFFGASGYGERQGWLMMPARVASALAPWLFGLALHAWGTAALGLSSALGLMSLLALLLLPR